MEKQHWPYSPLDIQLQPQERTTISEFYKIKNRHNYIEIEVISLDKTSPVIVSTYYDIYSSSSSVRAGEELQYQNNFISPLCFAVISDYYNESFTYCFVELPDEWLDTISLEEEECRGGSVIRFYSRQEQELGGEGLLFAIGIFEIEYDYSCKPWFNQSTQLGTYTDVTEQVYMFVQILPDPEMEIKGPTAYDALNSKTKAVIDSLYIESEYWSYQISETPFWCLKAASVYHTSNKFDTVFTFNWGQNGVKCFFASPQN